MLNECEIECMRYNCVLIRTNLSVYINMNEGV